MKKYIIHLPGTNIVSVPDLSVECGDTVLVVDEDRSLHNTNHATHWGENQLTGEIFTALYINYYQLSKPAHHRIYAI